MRRLIALALAFVLWPRAAAANELSPKSLALLALRVLAYDRNLKARADGADVVVVLLYRREDETSQAEEADLSAAFEEVAAGATVGGRAVRVQSLAYAGGANLDAKLGALRAAEVVVCHGLDGEIAAIAGATRKRAVLSIAESEGYVRAGLAVAVVVRDQRLGLVVNLAAARAERADLDAGLLRTAEVLR